MTDPWPCRCGAAGVRNLGTRGMCAVCLSDFYRRLPVEAFRGLGVGVAVSGVGELGDNDLVCVLCAASWCGRVGDRCPWCRQAVARQFADERQRLLWPVWAESGGATYDSLSPIDRQVWDATRGITRGSDSLAAWARRLRDAVHAGVVTVDEARAALRRARNRPTP